MALLNFQIVIGDKLTCGACDSVIVKTNRPDKLLINDGAAVEDIKNFFRAKIVEFEEVAFSGNCNEILFRYTIEYEDSLLVDVDDPFLDCDIIRICCAECLIDFIEENTDNHSLSSPSQAVIRLTRPDASFDDVDVTVFADLPITGDGSSASHLGLLLSVDAGNAVILGSDDGVFVPEEIITTLVDNGDNTFTYTSEDSTATVFDSEHDLSSPSLNIVRLTRPDTTFNDVAIDVDHTLTEPAPNTVRLTRPDATFDEVTISGVADITTTLVDNGDNTFTYTNEVAAAVVVDFDYELTEPVANTVRLVKPDGSTDDVAIDVDHDLTAPVPNTFRLTRPDTTFDEVSVVLPAEHTTLIGGVGFTGSTGFPYSFSTTQYTSDIAGPLNITAPAGRALACRVEISMRPTITFGDDASSDVTLTTQFRQDGGAWTTLSALQYDWNHTAGNTMQEPKLIAETVQITVPAGTLVTIEARLLVVSSAAFAASSLDSLNGGLGFIGSTV